MTLQREEIYKREQDKLDKLKKEREQYLREEKYYGLIALFIIVMLLLTGYAVFYTK